MGTVPRQESVPNGPRNAASGTFKMALLICQITSARARRAGKIKI
jgi:hypothetical protein